jgi:hypothetical protein
MELSLAIPDLRKRLREAATDRAATREIGLRASREVLDRFTWDKTAAQVSDRLAALAAQSPTSRPRHSSPPRPLLSLVVAARNDEATLGELLGSLTSAVEETVVVDAESEDRTGLLAREYGAVVLKARWDSSWSQIWNRGLGRATSRWILCLRGDERIEDRQMRQLRKLLEELETGTAAVSLVQPVVHGDYPPVALRQIRVVRNHHQWFFDLRAGAIELSLTRGGGRSVPAEIPIESLAERHPPAERTSRYLQARQILQIDATELVNPFWPLFNLGRFHFAHGDYFHAECYLHDALRRLPATEPASREVLELLIHCHLRTGDPHRAEELRQEARGRFPGETTWTALQEAVGRLLRDSTQVSV